MTRLFAFILAASLLVAPLATALGGRYYDARISRFTTPDPILQEKTPDDLAKMHSGALLSNAPYNYAFNNPVMYVDPDGKNPLILYALAALALSAMYPEPANAPGHGSPTYSTRQGVLEAGHFVADATMVAAGTRVVAKALTEVGAESAGAVAKGTMEGAAKESIGKTAAEQVGRELGKTCTEAQVSSFERQLAKDGARSLLKSKATFEGRLVEHTKKLTEFQKSGGFTSSVEREIANFKQQINAIDIVLKGAK